MRRHCPGCFLAQSAWPPARCPRCRRPTYVLTVQRIALAWALVGLAVVAVVVLSNQW